MSQSKNNLALLDKAVESTVAWELGEGEQDQAALTALGVDSKRYRNVAGLRVVSNASRDALVDDDAAERQDRLLRYRADRGLVLEKLKRVGVEPIATLPLKAWTRICDSARLYRFTPEEDTVLLSGEHYINEAKRLARIDDTKKETKTFKWILMVIAFLAAISFGLAIAIHPAFSIGVMLCLFGLAIFVADHKDRIPNADPKVVYFHLQRLISNDRGLNRFYENLWPGFCEPEKGIEAQILLPIPPADVQERLIKAERARMDLYVAVVQEAIHFRRNLVDVLIESTSPKAEAECHHPDLRRDPIAYVIEGSAVAIIDQYGDFPIEQEIVKDVVNSIHLV